MIQPLNINKINILLTEANGNLTDKKEMINNAVKTAEGYYGERNLPPYLP